MTKATEEYIREHAPVSEGIRRMPQKGYLGYMESVHQVTPEVIKTVTGGEKLLVSGAIRVATGDLAEMIVKAKEADEDPTSLQATVTVTRPNGPLSATVYAQSNVTNPATQVQTIKHGKVKVTAKVGNMVHTADADHARDVIAKLLG